MDRSRSRPSEVWRTDHPSDRQGGPIPRDRSSLHKQDVFNDFEAYELKLAVSRLSLLLSWWTRPLGLYSCLLKASRPCI